MRISDWSSDVCSSDLRVQDAAVDPHRITDKAQVDIALYAGIGVRLTLAQHLFAQDQAAILARNADRAPASAGDPADDFLVDGTGQDHFRDLRGFLVGAAQAAAEQTGRAAWRKRGG